MDINWKDITLKQFEDIQKLFDNKEISDFSKSSKLVEIIYNKNLEDIPLVNIDSYLEPINKLLSSRYNSDKKIKKEYVINGKVYSMTNKIENISTAQFIDYNEYLKQPNNTAKLLSCILIPKGHKYNVDYDIEEVIKDMECLPIEDVTAISFFLFRRLRKSQKATMSYSIAEVLSSKMKWKNKMKLLKATISLSKNME